MADNTQINDFFDLAAFAEQAQIIVNESAKTAKLMREQFAEVGKGLKVDGLNQYAAAAAKLQQTQKAATQVLSDYEKAQERLTKSQGDYNRDLERLDELLQAEAQSTAAMAAQNKALEQIRKNLNTTDKDYAATVQRIIDKQNANINVMKEFQNVEQKRTSGIGKYKEAIEAAMNSTGGYRQQLANIRNTMAELEQTIIATRKAQGDESAEVVELQNQYAQLQQRAGELQDAQNDMQARIRYLADDYANFNAVMEGMKGVTALGQGISGMTSLLGVNSKAVERSIQVMMSLQSIMNAINTIQQIFNKDSRIMVALSQMKAKAATEEKIARTGAAAATEAEAAATTHATAATRSFTAALASNPIGLIAVALSAAAAAFLSFSGALDGATESADYNTDAMEDNTDAMGDNTYTVNGNTEAWKRNIEARKEAYKGTAELLTAIQEEDAAIALGNPVNYVRREGALLEFVRDKLGQEVETVEEAEKIYKDFLLKTVLIEQKMFQFFNESDKYTTDNLSFDEAANSYQIALENLAAVKAKLDSILKGELDGDKDNAQKRVEIWEGNARYAKLMLDIFEEKTVGAYKKTLEAEKNAAKATKKEAQEVAKAIEESTVAQWEQISRSEKVMMKIGAMQRAVMDGTMTLEEYEKQLAEVTYSAQMEEWLAAVTQLEEMNKTLEVNSADFAKNQQEIVNLKREINDLTFKRFQEEIKKTGEVAKDTTKKISGIFGVPWDVIQAAAKKGMEAMLEMAKNIMETISTISNEMNASISEVSEAIYSAQAGRLAKEEAAMSQHYELQRAYIEANVHDEEERQQKLAQLALDEANAKAIAARKEAEVERRKAKVDLAITTAKASADVAAAIAAAVLTSAAGGDPYTVAVRIAAAVAAVLSAGAAVASAAAKIGNIPAFERGGEAKRGLVFRAGEKGYEVGEGVSGRSYLFPRDGVYMAPEPMRIHPHGESVQMVNNYNKAVTLRNSLTVKVIDSKRIEKYFSL